MKGDNIYNIDELKQLLSPQCEFRASGSLKEKIVRQAEYVLVQKWMNFRKFVLWGAVGAACVAAVVVATIVFIYNEKYPEAPMPLEANIIDKPDAAKVQPLITETVHTAMASNEIQSEASPKKISRNKQIVPVIQQSSMDEKATPITHIPPSDESIYDFEIPDFPEAYYAVFAMTTDEGPVPPKTLDPEEIIRRQEESTREYIDYMRQEIESAQQRIKSILEE